MEEKLIRSLRDSFTYELEKERKSWPSASFFLCRQDGVLIHALRSKQLPLSSGDEQSAGVLMGGVWQAACALMNLMPKSETPDFFRLSFDTTDKGVYLLPLNIAQHSFYVGALFAGEVNPAHMKSKIRNLVHKIENNLQTEAGPRRSDRSGELLFKDVSDDEVDQLFSAAGI